MADAFPKSDLVEIEWVDSASTPGWHQPGELGGDDDGLSTCRSVGYVFKRGKRTISLVQSQTDQGHVGELIAIPRSCVRVIRKLRR